MPKKRGPRLNTKKNKTLLDIWRDNDSSNAIRGKRKVVKGGIVKWVPIKKD